MKLDTPYQAWNVHFNVILIINNFQKVKMVPFRCESDPDCLIRKKNKTDFKSGNRDISTREFFRPAKYKFGWSFSRRLVISSPSFFNRWRGFLSVLWPQGTFTSPVITGDNNYFTENNSVSLQRLFLSYVEIWGKSEKIGITDDIEFFNDISDGFR